MDIVIGQKLQTGIYELICPQFDTAVVTKFAHFEWEIQYLESETTAFEWIDGHGIGPRFLNHLTEEDRVIRFLIECITNTRHAGPSDLTACQQTICQLHRLGVHHGNTNQYNFLIRGSTAVLIDFDLAQKCDNQDSLHKEFKTMLRHLQDTSKRGGGGFLPRQDYCTSIRKYVRQT